jgi:hypothetical protein
MTLVYDRFCDSDFLSVICYLVTELRQSVALITCISTDETMRRLQQNGLDQVVSEKDGK